jgi:hypothetical protein
MNSRVLIPSSSISSSLSNQFLTAEVKLCVSRRPWNVFEDTFNIRLCLRLENLTYGDIRYYYSSSLSDNLGFATLQRGDPNAASDPSKTSQRRRVVSFSMPSLLSIPTRRLDRWGATFLFEKVAGFAAIGSDNPLLVNLKLRRFRKGFTAIADCTSLAESNQHSPFIICWRA